MKKKVFAVLTALAMVSVILTGCGSDEMEEIENKVEDLVMGEDGASEIEGEVYYLSKQPQLEQEWNEIAALYLEETGGVVRVVTVAEEEYDDYLGNEMEQELVPTLFEVSGSDGYTTWENHLLDVSKTDLYSWITHEELALEGSNQEVYGIPISVSGYGILYNNAIMEQYCAMEGAVIDSGDEITSYAKLELVVEDMWLHKEELSIEGVFASTSLAEGEDWRWHTHLLNIPMSYESMNSEATTMDDMEFMYSDHYKSLLDLYVNYSAYDVTGEEIKSVEDSLEEFATGQVAMVQSGNWTWNDITQVEGSVIGDEDLRILPIYLGIEGEEHQGLTLTSESYFALNSHASEADQAATIAFLEWLYGTEAGKDAVVNTLGYLAPFSTFTSEELPSDPLSVEVARYLLDDTKNNMPFNFTTYSHLTDSSNWGSTLLEYLRGNMDWSEVKEVITGRESSDEIMESEDNN
ncbi:MAG: ABC transporter substrate-binding protein [Eubacteriales bacterium]